MAAGIIVVAGVGAHACAHAARVAEGDASQDGGVGEGAVVIVVVELIRLGIVGYEEVHPAVVIIVQHRYAQGFAGWIVQSGALGDVFKGAVAFVVE